MMMLTFRMRSLGVSWILACGLFCRCTPAFAQVSGLSLSSATSSPGGTVTLSLSFSPSVTSPAGLEWTLAYPASQITAISVVAGPVATAAAKTIYCSSATGSVTCLLAGPANASTMASGVAATVTLTLAPTAGTTAITITNALGVDAIGDGLTVSAVTNSIVTVPTISSLTCSPASLSASTAASCAVTLNAAAPTGGSAVTLGSNNASLTVPAPVTVASGSTTATFSATAAASIASNQTATVTATLGSSSQTATISLLAPVLVSTLACSPTSLGQSAVSTCTVTLAQTAPTGGSAVTLGSNNASLTVPASVTVTSGATTATFNATAAASIASNQSATVMATLGTSSKTATISLLAPVLVSTLACSPTSLGQSAVSTCTVTLTQTAPTGGSAVTLTSNNASLTVPASVTVASGATTATFSATAAASIASNQTATVTATLGTSSKTATISLLAPVLVSTLACSPTSLGQSAVSTCTVTLTQTAPTGGSAVTVASNNASLTVPASVTVASGATTATFSATAAASIASNQSATVTATLGSSSQTATISLLAPVLVSGVACSPTSLGQSAVSTCTVTLTQSAPTGGSAVTLGSNNASLTVPASVTVASGATTATFSATAAASIASNQTATVTATLGSSSQTATISLLAPVLVSTLACSPTSLGQSAVSTCTVTLTQTAPAGGSSVTLGSSNASLTVPASVTVAAGAITATFSATAAASIASNQSATVTATLGSSSQTATISLLAPVLVSGVACNPTNLGQSAVSTCTVTLTQTAPTGGSAVTLGSNNASLTVPASVTVASGATTATFSATAAASIASNQSATVTATLGSSSKTATISLLAPVLVSTLACSPTSLGQSAVSTCTVTLTQTAPAGGSAVTLGSNNASLTVPASVTVASGATTATFSATAAASIASNQSATVTATLGSSSQTATISLLAPVLVSTLACSPTSLGQNAVSTCTVTLTQTAPAGGSAVTLASNNASLTVPASVTVASGATTAAFSATAAASIASNQTATVTATLGSSSQTATISLLAPVLVSGVACSPTSLGQSAVSTCTVTLAQTAPAGGSAVTLASNNASLTVPASVTVAAGATTATFNATAAASIASNQSATVTATLGTSSQTATISLLAPVLVSGVVCSPVALGPGGSSNCGVSLTQAVPAIGLVHVTSCGPQTFPTSTCTIPPTGSGNLIVVGWQAGGGANTSVTVSSVTDNAGNTYAEAGPARSVDTVAGSIADVWYAMNSVSGATTLTITPSSTVTNGGAVIWEFSGADLSAPLDQTAVFNSQAASAAPAGAPVTTSAGADVVISLATGGNVTGISSGNNFVSDSALKGNGWAHLITSSGGTYAAQWNQSPAGTYASSTVAFKAAGSVTLTSNNPLLTVPASVTVLVGASTATFSATAAASIASNQSATVTATLGSSSQTAAISLIAPVTLSSLTCTPTKFAVGSTSSCTVALSANAAGSLAIGISSSNTAALAAPTGVTVQQGTSSTSFTVTAQAASAHSIVLTAKYNGTSVSQSLVLTAAPQTQSTGAVRMQSISCEPGRSHRICRVAFKTPPDSGTVDLSLASSNQSIKLPATITVQPGQSSVGFRIDAVSPATDHVTTITAKLGGDVVQKTVSLDSPSGPQGVPIYLYAKYGTRIQFRVSASDSLATLTASDLPAGAVFDSASGAFSWVPDVASQGTHHIVFTEVDSAGDTITASSILEADSGTPVVTRVINAANRSEVAACSPGAIASLEGRWLVEGGAASDTTGHSTELSGTVVRVNGIEVPILSASASRVDFVCPAAAPGSTLDIALQTPAGVAQRIQTASREATPGIFSLDGSGKGQGMIMHSGTATMVMIPNYQYPSRAALPDEPVTIYATGIAAAREVSVVAGGVEVSPQSIVPVHDFAGMYQISVQLPSGPADGAMSISLKMKMLDGSVVTSNEVWVATETLQQQ